MVGGYSQGLNRRKICRQVATPPQSSQEPLHPRFVLSGCKPPPKPVRRIAARKPLSLWQPDEAEVDGGHVTSKFVGQRWKRHRRRGVGRGDPPIVRREESTIPRTLKAEQASICERLYTM